MITLAFALLAAAQAPEQAPRMDDRPAPWPENDRGFGPNVDRVKESEPDARRAMARYAGCVADKSNDKVTELLGGDFTTTAYRSGLKNLVNANGGCAKQVGVRSEVMRSASLPFAGSLAEAMLRSDPAPLNVRLARAAAGKEAPTFAPSDKVAMCVARSSPDEVAKLFATDPGSAEENRVAEQLMPVVKLCSGPTKLETNVVGLRSIVATASFRLLAAQES